MGGVGGNLSMLTRYQRSDKATGTLLSVSQYTGVTKRRLREGTDDPDTRASSLFGYKVAESQDLVVNIMLAWNGSLGVAPSAGLVSPAYCVYRFPSGNPRFFHHLLRSPMYRAEIKRRSRGVVESRLRLYTDDLFRVPLIEPPTEEQSAIVRYLDQMERRINRFICNRRSLIQVLKEQKQAFINRAVTRGLDPNVPLKPSGIEWLGEIPSHWEITLLRLRYDQCLGKMVDAKQFAGEHATPYLRNVNVQWDRVNTDDLPLIDIAPHERKRFTVKPGDLLVCEGGDIGRCAFWDGRISICGFQKALHRLRPIDPERDHPRFLYYCMFNASKLGVFLADGSENTIAHLTGVKLRAHRFAFPPIDEQQAITNSSRWRAGRD
jgi:type I restriction enzyme, S subunit